MNKLKTLVLEPLNLSDPFRFLNAIEIGTTEEPNDTLLTATETGLSSANPGSTPLADSIGNNSEVAPGLDVDLFRLQLDFGDRLQVGGDNPFSNSSMVLRLFNSSGEQVAISFGNPDFPVPSLPSLNFLATASDTYYVGVSGGNTTYDPNTAGSGTSGTTGDYGFTLMVTDFLSPEEPNNTLLSAFETGSSSANPGSLSLLGQVGDNSQVAPGLDVDLFRLQLDSKFK